MVEIKRPEPLRSSSVNDDEEDIKYCLVYTKSKVYVNPTAYARDNIPGFVSLVKRVSWCYLPCLFHPDVFQDAPNPTYYLAWIPETLLDERGSTEWDKFVKVEEKADLDEEDDGQFPTTYNYKQTSCSTLLKHRCRFD